MGVEGATDWPTRLWFVNVKGEIYGVLWMNNNIEKLYVYRDLKAMESRWESGPLKLNAWLISIKSASNTKCEWDQKQIIKKRHA